MRAGRHQRVAGLTVRRPAARNAFPDDCRAAWSAGQELAAWLILPETMATSAGERQS